MIDYLFDRVIDVVIEKEVTTTKSSKQMVYKILKSTRTDVSQRTAGVVKGKAYRGTVAKSVNQGIVTIELWQGNWHYAFESTKDGKNRRVKKIYAKGTTYTFATLKEALLGTRPDGSLMQEGDRVHIIGEPKNRQNWHVLRRTSHQGSIETRVVEVTEDQIIPNSILRISCPPNGVKPDMTFSINLIPGQACYKAVLKIKNLCIDTVDIRRWKSMKVTAGYRNGSKMSFKCPIYSSYIESPNPDGVTVFEGLTVGEVDDDVLLTSPCCVHFTSGVVTVEELLTECSKGISTHLQIENALPDEVNKAEIKVSVNQEYYSENGMSLLNWLQVTLGSAIKQRFGYQLMIQLINKRIVALIIGGEGKQNGILENVISLDAVFGASFNGTALIVKAAWNPRLLPGDLFYLPPNFINASKLPNDIPEETYKNKNNWYRVITMSVNFSTVEQINEMQIMAIPYQYVMQTEISEADTSITADKYAAIQNERFRNQATLIKDLYIGNPIDLSHTEIQKTEVVPKPAKEKTGKALIDNYSNITELIAAAGIVTESTIVQPGDTLSTLSQYFCWEDGKGPKLDKTKIGTDKGYFNVDITEVNSQFRSYWSDNGIPAWAVYVPLCATLTYWRRQEELTKSVRNNWDSVNPKNISEIHAGKSLLMPIVTNIHQLAPLKNIYRDAYKDYKDSTDYPSWAKWWRRCYYYLGGTEEL